MVNRHTAKKIRSTHRYLGLFIGIQFIMWTVSGLYFSWTDIDEIHGDHYKKEKPVQPVFNDLKSPSQLITGLEIKSIILKDIDNVPYYLVNNKMLINAITGETKEELSENDAKAIASKYLIEDLEITGVERITNADGHHEYRGGKLPAYVVSFSNSQNVKAYVSTQDASFQTLRHRDWRWFDFLWMTHTMDYEGRDDFNNVILRSFSILGLITVLSGFTLWFTSSPSMRKLFNKNKKKRKNEKTS